MKKIILLAALFAAFTGCKKETTAAPEEKPYIKIPDEVWSYINLAPGSWYIYKDSATGLTDSVSVTVSSVKYKAPQYNFIVNSAIDYYNDDYNLTLEAVDLSGNKTAWLSGFSRSVIYPAATNPNYWEFYNNTGRMILMQYPSDLPGAAANYKIASAVIEGHIYSDIQVVRYAPAEVWWVKAVGIVKLTRAVAGEIKTSLLLRKK